MTKFIILAKERTELSQHLAGEFKHVLCDSTWKFVLAVPWTSLTMCLFLLQVLLCIFFVVINHNHEYDYMLSCESS